MWHEVSTKRKKGGDFRMVPGFREALIDFIMVYEMIDSCISVFNGYSRA